MKQIFEFHSQLPLSGRMCLSCCYLFFSLFDLVCFFLSSESGSLELGITRNLADSFHLCFHFYSHIIIKALKAKF